MFLLFPSEPTDSKTLKFLTLETSLQQAMGRTGSSHRSGLEVSMSLLKMRQRETSRAHSVSRTCGVTISPAPGTDWPTATVGLTCGNPARLPRGGADAAAGSLGDWGN